MKNNFWNLEISNKNIKKIFYLTGFAKFGFIKISEDTDCFKEFNISFDFNILKNAQNEAAIIDIDFINDKMSNDNPFIYNQIYNQISNDNTFIYNQISTFASVVYSNGSIFFTVLDNKELKILLEKKIKKNIWYNFNLNVNLKKIVLSIDNLIVKEYVYQDNIKKFTVSIGNNNVLGDIKNYISFKIKNVIFLINKKSYQL